MSRSFILSSPLLALLLITASGCAGDDSSTTADTDTGTDTDTDTGDAGQLGDEASQACRDAMLAWPALLAATDAPTVEAAYVGSAVQDYLRASDPEGARGDDAAILAAIADGSAPALAGVAPRARAGLAARLRQEIAAPEMLVEDPYAAWDEGYCLWSGALEPLAEVAALASTSDSELVNQISAAFTEGRAGISGQPPAAAIDDWKVPPAKQIIEKSLFTAAARVIIIEAKSAAAGDLSAARRALELFGLVRDRLEGRNTPGIAVIEGMLSDPGATIDPAEIERQMAIAFAKRTRKYCDEALLTDLIGAPAGYKGAVEGRTYFKLIAPDMAARLSAEGFDAAAHAAAWDSYVDGVRSGDDINALTDLAADLVEWNCAYQAALGIAACTASDDQPGA